jgi:hypothetical protein
VDIPLKNYYRYVLPNTDDYSSTGFDVDGPKAFFANMPLSKTLTMNLDVPEPWLVEPVIAMYVFSPEKENGIMLFFLAQICHGICLFSSLIFAYA